MQDFAYPFLQVRKVASDSAFHNLVVQVVVLNLCIATMVIALERAAGGGGEDALLPALKIVQVLAALGVVIFTGTCMFVHGKGGGPMRRPVSLASFAVAAVSLVLSVGIGSAGIERGPALWIEMIVAVLGVFWAWRAGEQSVG